MRLLSMRSLFLEPFLEELLRHGQPRDTTLPRYLEAAMRAARSVLGADAPLEAELDDLGAVRFHWVLAVVERVGDPHREITLLDAHRVAPDRRVGDALRVPLSYTQSPDEVAEAERLESILRDRLALRVRVPELWDVLNAELTSELLRDFPEPAWAEDSVATLMKRGGWLKGLSAGHEGVTLTVEETFWEFARTHPAKGLAAYGLVLRVEGAGPVARREVSLSDHRGTVPERPTGARAQAPFLVELRGAAEQVAREGLDALERAGEGFLFEVLAPPSEGSLLRWCERALPELLGPRRWTVALPGDARLALRVVGAGVAPTLDGFLGGVRFERETADEVVEDALSFGNEGPWGLAHGPSSPPEEAALRAIVERYGDWMEAELGRRAVAGDAATSCEGFLPLLSLLEARLRHGDPGTPPVPPLDAQDAEQLRLPRLREITAAGLPAGRTPALALHVGGFELALGDDPERYPFSDPWILLRPPGQADWSEVLRVDVWNPPARAVVDGDAFAFRRFVEWLRGALLRSDLDRALLFTPEDEDADYDEEDDEPPRARIELRLSDWLRFGLPYDGDRFLVDWRYQWDLVNSGWGISGFAGIYGMSPERVEQLDGRDRRAWRRFLCEVVDPRFAYAPPAPRDA